MRKITLTIVVLMCSQAFGLTLMGPPMANLEQGQYSVGIDYSFSEMDVEVSGYGITFTGEDAESNMIFTNLGYGIAPNLEAFLRLGAAKAEFEDFKGDTEFAYGFGIKGTFAQEGELIWGGLFQMSWLNSEDSSTLVFDGHTFTGIQEFDVYEIQIAAGPTYKMERLSIYGGPFLHFIGGNYDVSGTVTGPIMNESGSLSFDVEQESEFGGYVGLNAELTESSNWQIELQFTGDAYAICTGIGWKF